MWLYTNIFTLIICDFLAIKRAHGSKCEKQLYSCSFTEDHMIAHLIKTRPLTFTGLNDFTHKCAGVDVYADTQEWVRVVTEEEHMNRLLSLTEYLSYDKIMLESLNGVSGPTHFINSGSRYNRGRKDLTGKHESTDIIVGPVGARFERAGVMDSIHVLAETTPAKQDPQLSAIFHKHFGVQKSTEEVDVNMYKARMRISIENLLLETNERACEAGKKAYVQAVGFELGVWQV